MSELSPFELLMNCAEVFKSNSKFRKQMVAIQSFEKNLKRRIESNGMTNSTIEEVLGVMDSILWKDESEIDQFMAGMTSTDAERKDLLD